MDSPTPSTQFLLAGKVPLPSAAAAISTLDDTARDWTGRLLKFQTEHGHGWIGISKRESVPRPFLARLVRLYEYRGNRRGGVGKIEQTGHACEALWVMFATRHVGAFNFTDHVGHYNVGLFTDEPGDPVDDGTFWVLKHGMPGLKMAGFATIRGEPEV